MIFFFTSVDKNQGVICTSEISEETFNRPHYPLQKMEKMLKVLTNRLTGLIINYGEWRKYWFALSFNKITPLIKNHFCAFTNDFSAAVLIKSVSSTIQQNYEF